MNKFKFDKERLQEIINILQEAENNLPDAELKQDCQLFKSLAQYALENMEQDIEYSNLFYRHELEAITDTGYVTNREAVLLAQIMLDTGCFKVWHSKEGLSGYSGNITLHGKEV